MSAELERYQHAAPVVPITGGAPVAPLPPAADVDGWIAVVQDVAAFAERIAHTDFVPRAMVGKPAAITAAILAGREMGIAPMTALQNIHVIQGKPGQSALLMRALVLAKGHHIEYVEVTDSRVIVRGRRTNEADWTEVTFTADQAKKARIDLGGYPEDKLLARATARLCRRKFADVISGMAYSVEELQDGDAALIEAGEQPPALEAGAPAEPPAAPRTAQRKPAQRRATPRTAAAAGVSTAAAATGAPAPGKARPGPAGAPAAGPAPSGPPLPGEDGYDDPDAGLEAHHGNEGPPPDEEPPGPAQTDPATKPQNRLMHALFREAGLGGDDNRSRRLVLTGLILDRDLDTSAGLTVADAKVVIDALSQLKATDDFPRAVDAYVRAHQQRQAELDAAADESDPRDEDDAAAEQDAAEDPGAES